MFTGLINSEKLMSKLILTPPIILQIFVKTFYGEDHHFEVEPL
jgi:hypothetical protein